MSRSSGSPIIGAAQVSISITLNVPAPSPQTIAIACTGEGLTCPSSATITGSSASFNVDVVEVSTARTVSINATLNDVVRTAVLSLQPSAVQTMVASPTSVAAGVGSSVTIQLNRPVSGTPLSLSLTSSDTSVVKTPSGGAFFEVGEITKLVSLTTRAPQTQPKTVTITATGTRSTTLGTSTITASTTLTVTP